MKTQTISSERTKSVILCALFVALIAICSWISVPSAVPFTLQTFAVFLTAGLLGTKRSVITIICYIILGSIGVPVFAGFQGGFGVVTGPLGGYIIGFIFTALITGLIIGNFGSKPVPAAAGMALGLIVCYAFGTVWFTYIYTGALTGAGLVSSLSMCVIPFIIPDIIKITLAVILTQRLKKHINKV